MKVLVYARQTGKTTRCLKALRENPDAIMLVMSRSLKRTLYGPDVSRVFSWRHLIENPLPPDVSAKTKVIIDEPEFMPYVFLHGVEKLYDIILVAGTPKPRLSHQPSWFREKANDICNVLEHRTMHHAPWIREDMIEELQKSLNPTTYEAEVYASFSPIES